MIKGHRFLGYGYNALPFSAGETLSVHLQEQQLPAQVAKTPREAWGMHGEVLINRCMNPGWTPSWVFGIFHVVLYVLEPPGQAWGGWRIKCVAVPLASASRMALATCILWLHWCFDVLSTACPPIFLMKDKILQAFPKFWQVLLNSSELLIWKES